MSNNFRTDVEKVIEEADVGIISGSVYTYQSASFLVTDSGSVTQFHSPILIPVASASAMPTPLAGTGSLYVKGTDNKIYFKNDGGTEYDLTSGGGGGGGSPGGSDTQIQYNNGGSFGGVASMTFDDSSGHLTIIDDKQLKFGTNGDAHIEYNENGDDFMVVSGSAQGIAMSGSFVKIRTTNSEGVLIAGGEGTAPSTVTPGRFATTPQLSFTDNGVPINGIYAGDIDDGFDHLIFSGSYTQALFGVKDAENAFKVGNQTDSGIFQVKASGVIINENSNSAFDFRVESDGEDQAIFLDSSENKLSINLGETAFETHLHSTNDVAMSVTSAGVIFNEDGHATNDFRVESDNATHMLFVDSGNDRVSIGNTVDAPGAVLEVVSAANSGVPLILLDNDDTDKICLDIDAANIDADVIDITADAVTTAHVMDVTADGLTTGGILNLVSDSSDTSDRTLVKVTNDNTSATGTTIMHLKSDAITDDNPILLIESSAADTGPVLELRNTNAGTNREAILKFTRSDSSAEADDMDLGRLQFQGVDSGNSDTVYVAILAEASDITGGDEGGLLKFRLFSGGTGGTAASNTLFSIGGEDVANSTPCEVVVNEDGIDCNFRAESDNNTHMLHVDAGDDTASAGGIDATNHKDGFAVFNDFQGTTFESKLADGQFGSGEILKYSPGADDTLAAGVIGFLHTDGTWNAADASTVATGASQLLGVGLGGSSRTVGVLIRGFIRIPSTEILNVPGSGAVDGLPVYVSTTAAHFDFTAPSGSGDFVRIVGYAIDDDGGDVLVYFNPDSTFVEIA